MGGVAPWSRDLSPSKAVAKMSKNKQRGTAAEKAVVDYLHSKGFLGIERRALSGVNDKGDVAGIPQTVVEVKDHATLKFSEWLGELDVEMRNANAWLGAVWSKKRGKGSPADWYCVMPGHVFAEVLDRLYGDYLKGYRDVT